MAKAKEVVANIEKDVKDAVNAVKVELKEIQDGLHTIFTKSGRAEFKDGMAEVDAKVADELKDTGLVK